MLGDDISAGVEASKGTQRGESGQNHSQKEVFNKIRYNRPDENDSAFNSRKAPDDEEDEEPYAYTSQYARGQIEARGTDQMDPEPGQLEAEYEESDHRSEEEEPDNQENIRTNFLKLFHELCHEPNPEFLIEELEEMAKLLDQKLVYMEVSKAVDEILRAENLQFPLKALLDLLSKHMETSHREKILILLLVTGGIQRNFLEYSGVQEFFAASAHQTKCIKFALDSILKCYQDDQEELVEIFVGNMIELVAHTKLASRMLAEVCDLLVRGLNYPDCSSLSDSLLLRVFRELGSEEFNNITERALVNKKTELHRLWRWRTQSEASNAPDAFDNHSDHRIPDLKNLDVRKKLELNEKPQDSASKLPIVYPNPTKDSARKLSEEIAGLQQQKAKNANEYTFNAFAEPSVSEASQKAAHERNRLERARLERHSQKGPQEQPGRLFGDNFGLDRLGLLKKNMGVEDLQSSSAQTDFLQNSPGEDDSIADPYNMATYNFQRQQAPMAPHPSHPQVPPPSHNLASHGHPDRHGNSPKPQHQNMPNLGDPQHQGNSDEESMYAFPAHGGDLQVPLQEHHHSNHSSQMAQNGHQPNPQTSSLQASQNPQQQADRDSSLQGLGHLVGIPSFPRPPAGFDPYIGAERYSTDDKPKGNERGSAAVLENNFLKGLQAKYNFFGKDEIKGTHLEANEFRGSGDASWDRPAADSRVAEEHAWRMKFDKEKRAHAETLNELKKLNERFEEILQSQASKSSETQKLVRDNRNLSDEVSELRTRVKDLEASLKTGMSSAKTNKSFDESEQSSRITDYSGFNSPLDKVYSYYQTASNAKAREAALAILMQVMVEEQQLSSSSMNEFLGKCEKFDDKSFLVDLRE